MTDKDIMNHRFETKNIKVNISTLAHAIGIPPKEYEAACRRAMEQEAKEMRVGGK